jgi:protein-disulfide isomerase
MTDTVSRRARWRNYFDLLATFAMLIAAIAIAWGAIRRPEPDRAAAATRLEAPLLSQPLTLDGASLQGDPNAKLVLLIFSDFECPFCARFTTDTLPEIRRRYVDTKKVQVAFWNFPLRNHLNARRAAISAECASAQGRFWELHDALFQQTGKLSQDLIASTAKNLKLDADAFASCESAATASEQVDRDLRIGATLGVRGTPALFVATRKSEGTVLLRERIAGARPFAEFEAAFERKQK